MATKKPATKKAAPKRKPAAKKAKPAAPKVPMAFHVVPAPKALNSGALFHLLASLDAAGWTKATGDEDGCPVAAPGELVFTKPASETRAAKRRAGK